MKLCCAARLVMIAALVACADSRRSRGPGKSEPSLAGETKPVAARQLAAAIDPGVTYDLLEEKVTDIPIKTQIEQLIVASGSPSEEGLRAEIRERFSRATKRRGFKFFNPPSNIYIYVFGSEEQARAGQGLWVGMVAAGQRDHGEPEIRVNAGRLAALSATPVSRFGLTEDDRRAVFREIAAAELRATNEAMKRVPDTQIEKQIELERRLRQQYKLAVAKRHRLSDEQIAEIVVEGAQKGWPHR